MEWELAWYDDDNEAHLIYWDALHGQDIDITLRREGALLSKRDEQRNETLVPIDLVSFLFDLVKAANA